MTIKAIEDLLKERMEPTIDDIYFQPPSNKVSPIDCLINAQGHLHERASSYDSPKGERSMAKTVDTFAALTDIKMSEEQGWIFMAILKMVRSQEGKFKLDNYEDGAAYFALAAEAASVNRS